VGENRINTAHFYAESQQPGSGPQAVDRTIKENFGVDMDYYLRIRFEGFRDIVDAMGGVDVTLDEPTAGYPAGTIHLTGHKALAFVRDRANSDDFSRMSNGQLMLHALYMNAIQPSKWPYLPAAARAFFRNVDTDLPVWMIPRLVLMLLVTGPDKIDYNVLPREMVSPFTTDQGAMVLRPNWDLIHMLVKKIFF
jgi:polyisoprenyl-teichoic acid--peptidoglycan teichoic acid transferase